MPEGDLLRLPGSLGAKPEGAAPTPLTLRERLAVKAARVLNSWAGNKLTPEEHGAVRRVVTRGQSWNLPPVGVDQAEWRDWYTAQGAIEAQSRAVNTLSRCLQVFGVAERTAQAGLAGGVAALAAACGGAGAQASEKAAVVVETNQPSDYGITTEKSAERPVPAATFMVHPSPTATPAEIRGQIGGELPAEVLSSAEFASELAKAEEQRKLVAGLIGLPLDRFGVEISGFYDETQGVVARSLLVYQPSQEPGADQPAGDVASTSYVAFFTEGEQTTALAIPRTQLAAAVGSEDVELKWAYPTETGPDGKTVFVTPRLVVMGYLEESSYLVAEVLPDGSLFFLPGQRYTDAGTDGIIVADEASFEPQSKGKVVGTVLSLAGTPAQLETFAEMIASPLDERLKLWQEGKLRIPDTERFTRQGPYRLNIIGDAQPEPESVVNVTYHGVVLGRQEVDGHLFVLVGFEDPNKKQFFVPFNLGDLRGEVTTSHITLAERRIGWAGVKWSREYIYAGDWERILPDLVGEPIELFTATSFAGVDLTKLPTKLGGMLEASAAQFELAGEFAGFMFDLAEGTTSLDSAPPKMSHLLNQIPAVFDSQNTLFAAQIAAVLPPVSVPEQPPAEPLAQPPSQPPRPEPVAERTEIPAVTKRLLEQTPTGEIVEIPFGIRERQIEEGGSNVTEDGWASYELSGVAGRTFKQDDKYYLELFLPQGSGGSRLNVFLGVEARENESPPLVGRTIITDQGNGYVVARFRKWQTVSFEQVTSEVQKGEQVVVFIRTTDDEGLERYKQKVLAMPNLDGRMSRTLSEIVALQPSTRAVVRAILEGQPVGDGTTIDSQSQLEIPQ